MELLQPLRVVHIRLAARHVFDVARVHQQHLEAARFEDLEDGNPLYAGRLHRDGRDADLREPIRQLMEIVAEGPERANRPFISVARHGDHVKRRADIDAGSIWVQAERSRGCNQLLPPCQRPSQGPKRNLRAEEKRTDDYEVSIM